VDNIVAITFTEKAALEMKERIRAIVEDNIRAAKTIEDTSRWKQVKDDLSSASISTLHSFCDSIIRENYYLLGLEPDYDIIEEVDRKVILNRLSGEAINSLLEKNEITGASQNLLALYGTSCVTGGRLISAIQDLCSKIKEGAYDFKDVRKATEKNIEKVRSEWGGNPDENMIEAIKSTQLLVLDMAQSLEEAYKEYKIKEGLLDFNDLELYALKILENTQTREKYRERYRYFLVDEFQDTNELQRSILYHLVQDYDGSSISPRRLFIVGDHKQAIYGFRGTDYRIFSQVSEDISKSGAIKELSTCYRSFPKVVNTVNQLFSKLLDPYEILKVSPEKEKAEGPETELIIYTPQPEKDLAGDAWKKNKGLLKTGEDKDKIKDFLKSINIESTPDVKADMLGNVLSARIKKLKSQGFEYRDIAVLLRTRTSLAAYEDALKRNSIPYCVMGGIGFFDKQEVVDILNTYELVFSPGSLTSVAAALRSPIFGIPDDCLYQAFQHFKENHDLTGSLRKASEETNEGSAYALIRAAGLIERLMGVVGLYSAGDFLRLMIKELSYKEILLTQSQGFQKYRNIEKLMRIADEFDAKDMYHAREFIDYINLLRQEDSGSGEALLDTEDSDAVKILTIHASKGLEFRAVLIPGIDGNLTSQSMRMMDDIVFDPVYGIVAGARGESSTVYNPVYSLIQDCQKQKLIEEGKRLLYVAATRAIEYLGFLGCDCCIDKLSCDKLDSFIKQIRYAQIQCGTEEGLIEVDGNQLLKECREANDEKMLQEPLNEESRKYDSLGERVLYSCVREPSDQASISRYMTFRKCRRQYYFSCKAGLGSMAFQDVDSLNEDEDSLREERAITRGSLEEDEDKNSFRGSFRGTVVHTILESLVKMNVPRDQAESIIDEAVESYEPHNKALRQKLKSNVVRYVDNFYITEDKLSSSISRALVKREAELEFRMPLMENSSIAINGIIDRIDVYEGEAGLEGYIIDYKTDTLNGTTAEQLAERYKPQLMLYAKAFKELYYVDGKKPVLKGMYLYLLHIGEYVKIEYTNQELKELLASLQEVFEYTSLHDAMEDYPPSPSDQCQGCRIQGLCH
jgi:ATP-dependent helicase/nuclease subunit A